MSDDTQNVSKRDGEMKARYYAHKGMLTTEIDADLVSVITSDGTEVELTFRKSDGEISVSVNGQMLVAPRASNVVRVSRVKVE